MKYYKEDSADTFRVQFQTKTSKIILGHNYSLIIQFQQRHNFTEDNLFQILGQRKQRLYECLGE